MSDDPQLRELELLAASQPAALGQLIGATMPRIRRQCAALVDAGAADDLTQETFVRAMRSIHTYRGDAPAISWLYTIARRVCAEEIGRRQRERGVTAELARRRPVTATDPSGLVDLRDLVDRLGRDRRDAFDLTAVAGLSYLEAADLCDCPVGTIRSRVARARTELADAVRAATS